MINEEDYKYLTEAVTRGAALLDHQVPGWAQDIRLEQLEMNLCSQCVLGQIFRDFTGGYQELGLESAEIDYYGFDLDGELMSAYQTKVDPLWHTLDALWTTEVKRRTQS